MQLGSGKQHIGYYSLCYYYCFLSLCVVQVNFSYFNTHGFICFLLTPGGRKGNSASVWCLVVSWFQTTTLPKPQEDAKRKESILITIYG